MRKDWLSRTLVWLSRTLVWTCEPSVTGQAFLNTMILDSLEVTNDLASCFYLLRLPSYKQWRKPKRRQLFPLLIYCHHSSFSGCRQEAGYKQLVQQMATRQHYQSFHSTWQLFDYHINNHNSSSMAYLITISKPIWLQTSITYFWNVQNALYSALGVGPYDLR